MTILSCHIFVFHYEVLETCSLRKNQAFLWPWLSTQFFAESVEKHGWIFHPGKTSSKSSLLKLTPHGTTAWCMLRFAGILQWQVYGIHIQSAKIIELWKPVPCIVGIGKTQNWQSLCSAQVELHNNFLDWNKTHSFQFPNFPGVAIKSC